MKRQIINSTDHLVLDAEKITLMKIQPKNNYFCLDVCMENIGTYTIGTFDEEEDAIEMFDDISTYLWNRAEANIYFIKNNSCISKGLAKYKEGLKTKKAKKEFKKIESLLNN